MDYSERDDKDFDIPKSMIKEVFEVSLLVPYRNKHDVLASLMEEVGEVATEVNVSTGYSSKDEGPDGILGECVDVITCALDLVWVSSPNMTDEEIEELIMQKLKIKLEKWKQKKATQ